MAADVDSKYLINGFLYLRKYNPCKFNVSLSEHVVTRKISPYPSKGKNVTKDKIFITLKLIEAFKYKNFSLLGTVNRSREIVFGKMSKSEMLATTVLNHNDIRLTVFQGKIYHLLLSSIHPTTVKIIDNLNST